MHRATSQARTIAKVIEGHGSCPSKQTTKKSDQMCTSDDVWPVMDVWPNVLGTR